MLSVVTRWDPRSRAGAVAIKPSKAYDLEAIRAVSENVHGWATYQNLAGEVDNVETSPISGTYDWRAYLQEEHKLAQKREAANKPRKAQTPGAESVAAPSVFYQ